MHIQMHTYSHSMHAHHTHTHYTLHTHYTYTPYYLLTHTLHTTHTLHIHTITYSHIHYTHTTHAHYTTYSHIHYTYTHTHTLYYLLIHRHTLHYTHTTLHTTHTTLHMPYTVSIVLIPLSWFVDLDNSIIALRLVNTTVAKLLNLTKVLQTELDDLANNIQTLKGDCHEAGLGSGCDQIPNEQYTVNVDYTVVSNVVW